MNKHQRLTPILVLFGVLVLLLACSRFTNVPGAPSPTAPPRSADIDYWKWWEQLSWVATLVSLPIAAIALSLSAWEQKRIADELSRRPDVRIGFNGEEPIIKVEARQIVRNNQPINSVSEIRFTVVNRGTRTARDVLLNFRFPPGVIVRTVGWDNAEALNESEGGVLITRVPNMHRNTRSRPRAAVLVPSEMSELKITASATYMDEESQEYELTASVVLVPDAEA